MGSTDFKLETTLSTEVCKFCEASRTERSKVVKKGITCSCVKPRFPSIHGSSTSVTPPALNQTPNPTYFSAANQPKRAVLCGVGYKGLKHKLEGTVNDVNRMRSLLVDHFGFGGDAILVLTEEVNDPHLTPTKKNMQSALNWLVRDCSSGDSLVFYFSGHGLRQPDFNWDEFDGYDETICPSDFTTAGMILDNDLNNTIVRPLTEGVTLHAIIDACHSGTILDLEHVYNHERNQWNYIKPPSGARKSTNGGLAISLSACADDQMASDTTAFEGNKMTGALTYVFDETIKENPGITYRELLDEMHKKIELSNRTGCFNVPFLKKVFGHMLIQECQLSSSEEFDVGKEFKL